MSNGADSSNKPGLNGRNCVAILALSLAYTLLAVGCASFQKMYVEPRQAAAKRPANSLPEYPCNVVMNLETLQNGEPAEEDMNLASELLITSAVASSGFRIVEGEANQHTGQLDVTLNIENDIDDQRTSMVLTFYSLGLLGTTITGTLDLKMVYTPPGGEPVTKEYQQKLYTVYGFLASKDDLQQTSGSPVVVVMQLFEENLVNFEHDPQVQLAMAEHRRFRSAPTDHPSSSEPQIATLPAAPAVQPASLVTTPSGSTAPLFENPTIAR